MLRVTGEKKQPDNVWAKTNKTLLLEKEFPQKDERIYIEAQTLEKNGRRI